MNTISGPEIFPHYTGINRGPYSLLMHHRHLPPQHLHQVTSEELLKSYHFDIVCLEWHNSDIIFTLLVAIPLYILYLQQSRYNLKAQFHATRHQLAGL